MPYISRREAVKKVMREHTITRADGYRLVYCPMHPSSWRGYVYEHRLIAERSIGRLLRRDEDVHHINGDRADNRPANLKITDRRGHRQEHLIAEGRLSDTDAIRLLRRGLTYNELAHHGIGRHRIARLRKQIGIPRGRNQDSWRVKAATS